jgi:phenylalanyl-tRNA synthetase beta chain
MKVSLLWLQEFLDLKASEAEIANTLTLAGLEEEGVSHVAGDTIFDIALTPNLGHCMSILGVARELATFFDIPLKERALSVQESEGDRLETLVSVDVQDPEGCPRYGCRLVENVKVAPSPQWLVDRLEACGLRSVSNIVDVTNYVMLELGQPMHGFDFDKIEGGKIIVTSSASYSELETLDEEVREIPNHTLLICDTQKPLAIAGVMGANASSVTETTTRVLLEAACFSPQYVRKSSKALGMRTDSAIRFEKGVDPTLPLLALDRAAELLREVAGGRVVKGKIDISSRKFEKNILFCRTHRINELLGTQLSLSEIASFLKRLQIDVIREEDDQLHVAIPLFRNDIQGEIDLIEEVARVFGFNNIPLRPEKYSTSSIPHAPIYLFENQVRERLVAEGLQEWITCDLISPKLARLTHEKEGSLVRVLKAASADQSILRPSLLPSMLNVAKSNIDKGNDSLACFEVGRIHFKNKDGFKEESCAGILLTGKSHPYHWNPKPQDFDFFDLKGTLENLLTSLVVIDLSFTPSHLHHFHPKRQAMIHSGEHIVGVFGELHPSSLHSLDIEQRVLFAEINLHLLFTSRKPEKHFTPLASYPESTRDLTISVKNSITLEQIYQTVEQVKSPHLETMTLLDLYKSDQIGKDIKNVTLRFVYRDRKKTISQEIVDQEHTAIMEKINRDLCKID